MGAGSKIEWTHDTFNPWVGCEKVSPACKNCYAEGWAKRTGNPNLWRGARRVTSAANWRKPLKWNREAEESGEPRRVFCASLADVYEDRGDLAEPRYRLWDLVEATPALTWLMLTKRPENVVAMTPPEILRKLWVGTTAENQEWANRRVPELLRVDSAVRFLSMEPLLGRVQLYDPGYDWLAGVEALGVHECGTVEWKNANRIDWVIVGGESGPGARPMNREWALSVRNQCISAGVPFHFKQWGEHDCRGVRVGKKAAGRLLDGREWDGVPITDV